MDPIGLLQVVLLVFVALLFGAPASDAAQSTPPVAVYNGDFEQPAPQLLPPGWAMWGAQVYKAPANFARVTDNPHGGNACLRVLHPANTGGYLVTAPENALRPKRGMQYAVSFWARSDRPGKSSFGFTCYESIQPFVDAPSPGFFSIDVTPEWKQYSFTVREGWDLFAERSRYLLLTFKATPDEKEDRTLWVDDVTVREEPCDRAGRLEDADHLSYAPLNHRLRPGERLDFTLDTSKRIGKAIRAAGGVSFHRVAGWTGQPYDRQGKYTLVPQMEQAIREMRLPMTRFYGVGDEPFGLEGSIDRAAEMCRKAGIPLETVSLELEDQSANVAIAPDIWARAARYSDSKHYGFHRWEVANEPYSSTFQSSSPMGLAFPTSDAYVAHVRAVSEVVRRAQKGALIGIDINIFNPKWGNYVLKEAAGAYDFVAPHYYAGFGINGRSLETIAVTDNMRMLDTALRTNALIKAYNPGRNVCQYDTEWGLINSGPNGEVADDEPRNANILGALHRAVRMIYYAREGMLQGASSWQMFSNVASPGFGILSQQAPDQRFLLYWLYYAFNRHVGEWALDLDGTAPFYPPASSGTINSPAAYSGPLTPVLATLSSDGKALYLVIANASADKTQPCVAHLKRFNAASAEATVLSQSDREGSPLIARKEDAISGMPVRMGGGTLNCELPARSVAFITLRRK